jgi:hypothetical protein
LLLIALSTASSGLSRTGAGVVAEGVAGDVAEGGFSCAPALCAPALCADSTPQTDNNAKMTLKYFSIFQTL